MPQIQLVLTEDSQHLPHSAIQPRPLPASCTDHGQIMKAHPMTRRTRVLVIA